MRARRAPVVGYGLGRTAELVSLLTGRRGQVDTEMAYTGRCLALPCSTHCALQLCLTSIVYVV